MNINNHFQNRTTSMFEGKEAIWLYCHWWITDGKYVRIYIHL